MDIDPRFLNGMIVKISLLGLVASLGFGFLLDPKLGVGIFAGTAVSVLNLRAFVWTITKLVQGQKESKSQLFWSFLLGSKMMILIGTIWFLISVVDLSVVGLVFGFSLFLPSMVWQLIAGP